MGFMKLLIGLPILIVILIFAFVNNDLATFDLWPFYFEITVSLSVAVVFFILLGFILGLVWMWMSYAPVRKALRQQVKQNKKLSKEQIESLKSNISSVELQNKQTENSNNTDESDIKILTEKGNVSAEILTYEDKKQEYEAYLKDYDIKNNNCTIKAGTSGYFYTNKEISNGTYIQEGDSIGQIYPKEQSGYYAQVYVENSDIAKIKPDQEVKFEMASYPSSEYGYFTGTVKEIAKDVTVDQNTGNAYYVVKVECKNMEIKNKDGEKGNLKSGMAAQAKIVVDDDSVLHFVLSKINLVD